MAVTVSKESVEYMRSMDQPQPGILTVQYKPVQGDEIFENGSDANNVGSSANLIEVLPSPYADLVVETATVNTPAVGFALFYIKGVCPPEIKVTDIYKGVMPFITLQLIGLALIYLIPEIVTWLPSVAYQ